MSVVCAFLDDHDMPNKTTGETDATASLATPAGQITGTPVPPVVVQQPLPPVVQQSVPTVAQQPVPTAVPVEERRA
jgi:hypothetical protein